MTEFARIVYVGLSRAEDELYLYLNVADVDDIECKIKAAFNAYILSKGIAHFYEIVKIA